MLTSALSGLARPTTSGTPTPAKGRSCSRAVSVILVRRCPNTSRSPNVATPPERVSRSLMCVVSNCLTSATTCAPAGSIRKSGLTSALTPRRSSPRWLVLVRNPVIDEVRLEALVGGGLRVAARHLSASCHPQRRASTAPATEAWCVDDHAKAAARWANRLPSCAACRTCVAAHIGRLSLN